MSAPFQRIGLIGKHGDPTVKRTIRRLYEFLVARKIDVLLENGTCRLLDDAPVSSVPEIDLPCNSDLVIVVGGDGTLLHAARELADQDIPLLGINRGRLGFLADVTPNEMLPRLEEILAGKYEEEQRFLLSASIGDEPGNDHFRAFNDVVLHKWNTPRMIEFETYIDGKLVNDQRSDGLIVSTPTGSTAYALSGGGPLLYPTLDALLLVPICPHTLSNRPIVVDGNSRIEIHLAPGHAEHVQVTCDGQTHLPVIEGEAVQIRKNKHHVRLIHPRGHDHFSLLRAKLGWSEHPTHD
ncbi:NAD(+) kinase [endosymbiont of Ridgeia piscesae]|jgi:NAD+ kinase|uniref:NAD kinase n=1 Tax=endosymbiont of Ridgeia piscesae TaxID=54398 RepID=A0A0T5YY71_9GAMM|nr:NAD(+) kinase [endosymbiont of Ridgeia piscesae]KRT55517.1 NAD kinase [endosymbiont of Ridgeia piscesae]KRT59911.1 NAD+ kinase [endosymbiont of Ridgeia piscesae]